MNINRFMKEKLFHILDKWAFSLFLDQREIKLKTKKEGKSLILHHVWSDLCNFKLYIIWNKIR